VEKLAVGRRCDVCGAELAPGPGGCPYAESFERAPGIGDVLAMVAGELTDAEHELAIARWRVHHAETVGPRALDWARRRLAEEA
jgi:hypothetical protein